TVGVAERRRLIGIEAAVSILISKNRDPRKSRIAGIADVVQIKVLEYHPAAREQRPVFQGLDDHDFVLILPSALHFVLLCGRSPINNEPSVPDSSISKISVRENPPSRDLAGVLNVTLVCPNG